MGKMHAHEVDIDSFLVARLLAGQFPQWADLPLRPVESGVNPFYRTGRKVNFRQRECRQLQTQQEANSPGWSEVSSHYTLFR